MSKMIECPRCYGDGEEPGAPYDMDDGQALCSWCGGTGEIPLDALEKLQKED